MTREQALEKARDIVRTYCEHGVHHEILSEWIETALIAAHNDAIDAAFEKANAARTLTEAGDLIRALKVEAT